MGGLRDVEGLFEQMRAMPGLASDAQLPPPPVDPAFIGPSSPIVTQYRQQGTELTQQHQTTTQHLQTMIHEPPTWDGEQSQKFQQDWGQFHPQLRLTANVLTATAVRLQQYSSVLTGVRDPAQERLTAANLRMQALNEQMDLTLAQLAEAMPGLPETAPAVTALSDEAETIRAQQMATQAQQQAIQEQTRLGYLRADAAAASRFDLLQVKLREGAPDALKGETEADVTALPAGVRALLQRQTWQIGAKPSLAALQADMADAATGKDGWSQAVPVGSLDAELQQAITDSTGAEQAATQAARTYRRQTGDWKVFGVTGDADGPRFMSGWADPEQQRLTQLAQTKAQILGSPFPSATRFDQGELGRYAAAHVEPHAELTGPADVAVQAEEATLESATGATGPAGPRVLGISFTPCPSCRRFLETEVPTTDTPLLVRDPTTTRIFYPNGTVGVLWNEEPDTVYLYSQEVSQRRYDQFIADSNLFRSAATSTESPWNWYDSQAYPNLFP